MSTHSLDLKYLLISFLMLGALIFAMSAHAQPNHTHRFYDSRHHHNHYYPKHGHVIKVLPPRHNVIVFRDKRFFFSAGIWYEPRGTQFVIATPPIGLTVNVLPPEYTTVIVGRVPYYYANHVYYVRKSTGEYMVTEAPNESDITSTTQSPPIGSNMFIYPNKGQTQAQQDRDRFECHDWAVKQTGFDPSLGVPATSTDKSSDYKRAMSACLEGRSYTVK